MNEGAHLEPQPASAVLHTLPQDASLDYLKQLALDPSCSAEILEQLAAHDNETVRCELSSRRHLPTNVVWLLASDKAPRVRYRLAANRTLSRFVLETLAEDEHGSVAERAERTLKAKDRAGGLDKVLHLFFTPGLKEAG